MGKTTKQYAIIPVRMTCDEETELRQAAKLAGMPMATFIRRTALAAAQRVVPAVPAGVRYDDGTEATLTNEGVT